MKKPAGPSIITLPNLIARLIEAEVPFKFVFDPDPQDRRKKFVVQVSEEVIQNDDGLTALLTALAKGVKSETVMLAEMQAVTAKVQGRIGRVNAMLPELGAHIPTKEDGTCDECGDNHKPLVDAVRSAVDSILGGAVSSQVVEVRHERSEPKKKPKKGPN